MSEVYQPYTEALADHIRWTREFNARVNYEFDAAEYARSRRHLDAFVQTPAHEFEYFKTADELGDYVARIGRDLLRVVSYAAPHPQPENEDRTITLKDMRKFVLRAKNEDTLWCAIKKTPKPENTLTIHAADIPLGTYPADDALSFSAFDNLVNPPAMYIPPDHYARGPVFSNYLHVLQKIIRPVLWVAPGSTDSK